MRYDFPLTNTALPRARSLGATIAALPGLASWFQAQDDYLAMASDRISEWSPRAGSSPIKLTQATLSKQADLSVAQINGWPAAAFRRTDQTVYAADADYDMSGDFAMAVLFRNRLDATSQTLIAALESSTVRFGLGTTSVSGAGIAYVGAVTVPIAVPADTWMLAVLEKTATQFRARVNGVQSAWTGHINATSTEHIRLGAPVDVSPAGITSDVSDVWIFDRTILGDPTAFDPIRSYVQSLYGISGQ